ncbi:HIG1 domain family member 2A-like isoform X1 [Clavelina lepadiformis]|uniref:HIG1 domain-containing protein n=1 Tax=Clavelina lepadiformis TaxID=159417 RepID=A0ABP0FGE0_CLALP
MESTAQAPKKLSKEEILKQLPDEFEKLSLLGKLSGPPSTEDYQPLTMTKQEPFLKNFFKTFNPFVPLGLAGVVYFISNGLRHMVRRDRFKSQEMMRGRVFAQAFTLVAVVGGMYYEVYRKQQDKYSD